MPAAVGPSPWALPDPETADPDTGLVGFGADLDPATLVDAYRRGIFPWPHAGLVLPWFSPDPRGIVAPPDVHLSRSLRRRLRRSGWTTTVDAAFPDVVAACAEPRDDGGTWITDDMWRAYTELNRLGWAHSVEVWEDDRLIGGLYGVQVGAVFTGESMFHRLPDASKVAFVDLAARFASAGGRIIDVQLPTDHLCSLGVTAVERNRFLSLLASLRDDEVDLPAERLPAARLTTGR